MFKEKPYSIEIDRNLEKTR